MTDREKVLATARGWLGIHEGTPEHHAIIDLYNANRPAGSYKMTYEDPWCASFVSAVGMKAGVLAIFQHVNCDGMIAEYRQRGQFVASRDYPAKPGDLVFYDWDGDGSSDHVGIVVEDNEHYYVVIEGNYSDMVKRRTVAHGSKYIVGFAVPGYGAATNTVVGDKTDAPGQAVIIDKPDGAVVADGGETVKPKKTCTVQLPVLYMGDGINDPSDAVRSAQLLLAGRGFRCGYSGADGEFGEQTRTATQKFQSSCDIAVDGVIGAETWQALLT